MDGHDLAGLTAAFAQAKTLTGAPTMILAKTIKGKGVSFMENQAGWHGKAPNAEQYQQGAAGAGRCLGGKGGEVRWQRKLRPVPLMARHWWNWRIMEPNLVVLDADLSGPQ